MYCVFISGLVIESTSSVVSSTDAVLGGLQRLSVQQSPGLAKAWLALAGTCYRWGRRSVDATSSSGKVYLSYRWFTMCVIKFMNRNC